MKSKNIFLTRKYTNNPEGSVLVEFGNTKVLCTASIIDNVPNFLKGKKQGWITAEYSMLPRSTHVRHLRESVRGNQYGRNIEIQRFISRSLRASIDLTLLNKITIVLDCDVLEADGGTRTAAITGSCIALTDAINFLIKIRKIKLNPIKWMIAAVSVGIVNKKEICNLDYSEDSIAEVDMNIVMAENGNIIEIQGNIEGNGEPIKSNKIISLLELAKKEIFNIIKIQKKCFLK